ncbi:SDR family NAD(P)-dependent oxidoreductase [Neolewinella antarctica]|uniref:NAD(P)-dependent dehydrogenase (Short-subunit alcohol dehydrogenase family) n=1 Tax=Neolewinella antarctica TaxID=442734 RepID=A0ABX0X9B4_9BACT|nr:SDR family oxidoreductase [Neolewinella antarctica]NJC25596.1 NAD(P)-dependent dehydrogenase (short-subunit alcohol dehydrogenase family) [Neolewinella antarctica]
MNRLKDKVAIITGGANGIGLATAKRFLREGAKVMIVDNNTTALKKATEELASPHLQHCRADVSQKADVEKYVDATLSAFGNIDVFFNNAGIEGAVSPIATYPEDEFDRVMAVNVKGVWLGCQCVIPKMRPGGSVIITSSVAGLRGFANLGAYAVSKHAEVGIMRVAAVENADRKIRVNSIHPGPVETQMMRHIEGKLGGDAPDKAKDGFESQIPFGRYALAEEIADLVLFLSCDESKYITGNTHVIDGGMHV